jgi:two-component system, OmpR family, KDP operon response regulator KdpE
MSMAAEMATPAPVLLVIEDEEEMQRLLRTTLRAHGYQVIESVTAREGLMHAAGRNPDVILLDLGLPDRDGLDVLRTLRASSSVPVIVISARGREVEKVAALDEGADDYLTKPFGVSELLARVRVALRHASSPLVAPAATVLRFGDVRVDLLRREVWQEEVLVHLTPIEYRLLAALVREAGRVITHRKLLREVWGPNAQEQPHYLRVYMAQLRRKLEHDPTRPRLILTESGVGYRMIEPVVIGDHPTPPG